MSLNGGLNRAPGTRSESEAYAPNAELLAQLATSLRLPEGATDADVAKGYLRSLANTAQREKDAFMENTGTAEDLLPAEVSSDAFKAWAERMVADNATG